MASVADEKMEYILTGWRASTVESCAYRVRAKNGKLKISRFISTLNVQVLYRKDFDPFLQSLICSSEWLQHVQRLFQGPTIYHCL